MATSQHKGQQQQQQQQQGIIAQYLLLFNPEVNLQGLWGLDAC